MSSSNQSPLDTLDKLHIVKSEIYFISNLLNAWDLNEMPISHNDMFSISRICDKISTNVEECEEFVKSTIKIKKLG